jgi:hypothetical protein
MVGHCVNLPGRANQPVPPAPLSIDEAYTGPCIDASSSNCALFPIKIIHFFAANCEVSHYFACWVLKALFT